VSESLTPDEPSTVPHVRLEMFSQPRFLAPARAMLASLAQRLGFPDSHCGQISLAIDEAISNVIKHGYDRRPDGRIWISAWHLEAPRAGLRIEVDDLARQVEPETIRSRDLEDIRPGGLGVHIIKEVMDECRYEKRAGGGMKLTMVKYIDSAACCGTSADTECCGGGSS
jgi:serine/threonine-protein kinase RsbW